MVRTRIAPSPTGEDLHIGNLYTAYFNWAFARQHGGQFIVRIEDTDRTRLVVGSEEKILQTLKSFGLAYDEGVDKPGPSAPYRQSERLDIYHSHADELIKKGAAYYCFCTSERLDELRKKMMADKKAPMYDKHCLNISKEDAQKRIEAGEKHVIRLNVPKGKEVVFNDLIRGDISFNTDDIDDQILIKSDGFPTYHMAVVIDDYLMKISHVIRAEEWISSTPKHLLLYEAFGWPLPIFAHVPILRNPDKSKLSKRKNPVWATWYLTEGYLPEAMLNYLSLMGWSHPEGKEIFTTEEFIKTLDLKRINSTGPVFDVTKLEWMNGEYIRQMELGVLKDKIHEFFAGKYSPELLEKTVPLIQERIKTLKEYEVYCSFFTEKPAEYEVDLSDQKELLKLVSEVLENISDDQWKADHIGEQLQNLATKENVPMSKFFMMLRVAMTGKKVTPPLNESMEILGKEECLERVTKLL